MKTTLIKISGILYFLFAFFLSEPSWAISLNVGTPVVAIDGNSDGNVTVDILSVSPASPSYTYGYFLDGSPAFTPLSSLNVTTFQGGDVIDFALYDGANYYSLSGDYADNSYSVQMGFDNPVTIGAPQQPADWSQPYYYNVNISWSLPNTFANTNELALSFTGGNDGVAPAPEPASLLLLGSGLLCLGVWGRSRLKGAQE